MNTVRLAGIVPHSLVDGPGIRFTVFFQGCPHGCPGCHNPETHGTNGGTEISIADVIQQIRETRFLDGVTLSGGEPFLQPDAVIQIADAAHKMGLNVWCYTGYTIENIPDNAKVSMEYIDTLVDGPFVESLTSGLHIYCGSSNQRIINMKEWLSDGEEKGESSAKASKHGGRESGV